MKNPWHVLLGRERLIVVFWGYCVVGTAIVVNLPNVDRPYFLMSMPLSFFLVLASLQTAYLLWSHMSLWTCAFNTSRRAWGYAARAYIIVLVSIVAAGYFIPVREPALEVLRIL